MRFTSCAGARPIRLACAVEDSSTEVRTFNVADPAFSVRSPDVRRAREQGWYVRTNYGLAVLRYDQVDRLLTDRRLKQGSDGVAGPPRRPRAARPRIGGPSRSSTWRVPTTHVCASW